MTRASRKGRAKRSTALAPFLLEHGDKLARAVLEERAEPLEPNGARREEDGWHPIAWDGLLTGEQIYVHVEALRDGFRWSAHVWPEPVRTGSSKTERDAKAAALAAAEALCTKRKRDKLHGIRRPLPPDLPGLRAQFKRCR